MVKKSQVQLSLWYLQRPSTWGHFAALLRSKVQQMLYSGRYAYKSESSRAWCAEQARPKVDVYAALRVQPVDFDMQFADELRAAHKRVENVPVKMGGAGDMQLLYALAKHLQATRIIETGVAYGWSSFTLLLALQHNAEAQLISTDMPYFDRNNAAYVGVAVPEALRGQWTLLRNPDRVALRQALRQLPEVDLCHYDSDKSYDGRMWAYDLLWQALRPAGILISDDINDNFAFRDFSLKCGSTPFVIAEGNKYIGILVKSYA